MTSINNEANRSSKFERKIENVLNRAIQIASFERNEYLSTEILALALIEDQIILQSLQNCQCDIGALTNDLMDEVRNLPQYPENVPVVPPKITKDIYKIIQRAMHQVSSAGKSVVEPYHLLASLLMEHNSTVTYVFKKHGIHRLNFLHGIQDIDGVTISDNEKMEVDPLTGQPRPSPDQALKQFCIDLNELAKNGGIDQLVGRKAEIERTVQILCRRRKNNPLLVGEPGVGKTAIAEGLALRITQGNVPSFIKDAIIYSLDMGALMAGAKFRGDVEERLKAVLEALKEINKNKKAILFIDEIHTIVGAGATQGGTMDVGNLLKPALAKGDLRCIGSTTYKEYEKSFQKDLALRRRFKRVDIIEPSPDEAKKILRGLADYFADYHDIKFTPAALDAAVDLSVKHIFDNFLPDKAIDIIDEAGAAQRLLEETDRVKLIDVPEIEKVVAKIARLPEASVNKDSRETIRYLEDNIKNFVFGQDTAVKTLTKALKISYAGLRPTNKPIGSYLFAGPTGVGKTEVAKQLARNLNVPLIRFDMSEFTEKHTVAKFIGSPAGYVGHDDGDGQLIEEIDKNPHCILLFDEIEKAHPDLFNIFLQIMDEATLTGSRGKKVSFKNVVLIMTTNAGSVDAAKNAIGFGRSKKEGMEQEAIIKLFPPEFRNRLDAIVHFGTLTKDTMLNIVQKFLNELQVMLDDKDIIIETSQEALMWLAEKGYDPEMGARPLARFINDNIKEPMAEELLFGTLADGAGKVTVFVENNELKLKYSSLTSKEKIKIEDKTTV